MSNAADHLQPTEALMESRQLIEQELRQLCSEVPEHSKLRESFEYALFPAGKRVRPLIAVAFCSDLKGDRALAISPACAIELLHTASLIHDDLPALDNDDQRRGRPSCHKAFGEATAILLADYITALAFNLASKSTLPSEIKTESLQTLTQAYMDVCRGQLLDLDPHTFADLEQLHLLKTGSLFSACFKLGALVAGQSASFCRDSQVLGLKVGVTFQIIDDYLDVFGTDLQRGRTQSSDLRNERVTYFSNLTRDQGSAILTKYSRAVMELIATLERHSGHSLLLTRQLIEKTFAVL